VDGGANSGLYSLVAGAVNPRGRIFAFEPVSHIFARLVENVSINSFDVVAEELALSDSSGTAAFYLTPGEFAVNSSLDKLSSTVPGATEIRVKTVRLDEYLAEHGVEGIDLLKLDVEGHEPQALQGLGALLSKNRPKILIEINRPQTGEEIAKIFQGLNYRYFIIDEGVGLTEVAQPIPAETIWGQNYYLCPAEEADSYSAPSSRH
jgi:FkbM family methyltransferase